MVNDYNYDIGPHIVILILIVACIAAVALAASAGLVP